MLWVLFLQVSQPCESPGVVIHGAVASSGWGCYTYLQQPHSGVDVETAKPPGICPTVAGSIAESEVVPGVVTLSKVKPAASVCTMTLEPVLVKLAVLHSP